MLSSVSLFGLPASNRFSSRVTTETNLWCLWTFQRRRQSRLDLLYFPEDDLELLDDLERLEPLEFSEHSWIKTQSIIFLIHLTFTKTSKKIFFYTYRITLTLTIVSISKNSNHCKNFVNNIFLLNKFFYCTQRRLGVN